MRSARLAVFALLAALLSACASRSAADRLSVAPVKHLDVVSSEELRAPSLRGRPLYDVIQQIRPIMLSGRRGVVVVYVNGVLQTDGLATLRRLNADEVVRVQRTSAITGSASLATSDGPVLLVTLRKG